MPAISDNSYYKLYTLLPSGEEYKVVSSEDTNSLNQIWKDAISRKGAEETKDFLSETEITAGKCIRRKLLLFR